MSDITNLTSQALAALLAQTGGTAASNGKLESFGFFLEDYVISGGAVTVNAVDPATFTISEAIVSFNDAIYRQAVKTMRVNTSGSGTYYVDFTVTNGFVLNTAHPTEAYLPLWTLNVVAGAIASTVDNRGTMGFVRFRSEIAGLVAGNVVVDELHISDNAVGTAKVKDAAVTTAKIADKAVTYPKLGIDLQAAGGYEKEWTASEGQTVFDLSGVGTYTVGVPNALVVVVGGLEQSSSAYTETSPTIITLSEGVSVGTKVIARWRNGLMPTTSIGHQGTHQKGQPDELNIANLSGYDSLQTEFDKRGVSIEKYSNLVVNGDWTAAVQNAYNSLVSGQTLIIPAGNFLISNLVFDKDNVSFECRGTFIQKTSATGVAVTIGKASPSFGVEGNLNVSKQTRDWTQDNTGVKILNMNEGIFTVDIRDFTKNLELEGNNNGCSYNEITAKKLMNGKKNLAFTASGTGWVNENKFYSGRFQWNSGIADTDRYHIYIPSAVMNNNVFFSPSLESADGGTLIYCNGQYTHFYSPRLEADASTTKVKFDTLSLYNQLIYPYAHTDVFNDATYIDLGSRNHIYGRDTIQLGFTQIRPHNIRIRGGLSGNPNWGNNALVDVQSVVTSSDKLWSGKDSGGTEKSSITGDGVAAFRSVQVANGFMINFDGSFTGTGGASDSYASNGIKVSAVKATAGAPAGSVAAGVQVLNTNESKLYISMGGGVWKSVALA